MQEYTGIESGRLELMEERLAEDVRREAARNGRVLVAREVQPSSQQAAATIQDFYETLTGKLLPPPPYQLICRRSSMLHCQLERARQLHRCRRSDAPSARLCMLKDNPCREGSLKLPLTWSAAAILQRYGCSWTCPSPFAGLTE